MKKWYNDSHNHTKKYTSQHKIEKIEDSGVRLKIQPLQQIMNNPSELNEIQPRATRIWNCDEIGFDPNGNIHKVIYTYKLIPGEQMWRVKTGEWSPFCCTLLVFNWDDRKWFMSPILVHQEKEYSPDLHFNILLD